MNYYIIETQARPDGIINISNTQRSSFASALSYYHERYSKMAVTELYTSVSLMLVDQDLTVIQQDTIKLPLEG